MLPPTKPGELADLHRVIRRRKRVEKNDGHMQNGATEIVQPGHDSEVTGRITK